MPTASMVPKKAGPKRILNYRPDLPDKRDHYYTKPRSVSLPKVVDMRKDMTKIEDQGSLGSCTAHAITSAIEYLDFRADRRYRHYSRLFLYYNERVYLNAVNEDSGAYIRDGIKSLRKDGICNETDWPYVISKFKQKPPQACYAKALNKQTIGYKRIDQKLTDMLGALAEGYPIIFGFTVYDSFLSDKVARTGVLGMPDLSKETVQGGHAVLAVGYDQDAKTFLVRNSWGSAWGKKGYFTMPFDYLLDGDLAEDFWIITQVESIK